jgi:hypothetical protein
VGHAGTMNAVRVDIDDLLASHGGDDRCGCLRDVVLMAMDGRDEAVLATLQHCLGGHPSGAQARRDLIDGVAAHLAGEDPG